MCQQREGNGFKFGRGLGWLCALGLAVIGLRVSGCGGSARSPVAVRVGDSAISEAAVAHWARVIATGSRVEGFAAGGRGGPRRQALELLIAAAWLRKEALGRDVAPSGRAVDDVLAERWEANGTGEFEQSLRASGQTTADVRLEIEAELDAAAIRRDVLSHVPAVGEREVLAYYKAHRSLFRRPQKRTVDLLERLGSPAAARALVRKIGTGAGFRRRAIREELQLHGDARPGLDTERVTRAVFAAGVGVPSQPLPLGGHWTVFVVRKVVPARLEPLQKARAEIVRRLMADRRKRALATFSKTHPARWAAIVDHATESGA